MNRLGFLLFVLLFVSLGCTRAPAPSSDSSSSIDNLRKNNLLAVGQSVVFSSAAVIPNQAEASVTVDHVYLRVLSDSKPLSDNSQAVLLFYKTASDSEPVYTFTVAELRSMGETTHCPDQVAKYTQDAKTGEGLFCNKSFELNKVNHFVLKEGESKMSFATSYTTDFVDKRSGVLAVTIGFN